MTKGTRITYSSVVIGIISALIGIAVNTGQARLWAVCALGWCIAAGCWVVTANQAQRKYEAERRKWVYMP